MANRVLILSTAYLPLIGGSELAIRAIAERLGDWEFDLITKRFSSSPATERIGRVQVYRVRAPKPLLPLAIACKALQLMFRRRYALVHAYQASQAAGAAWLLKFIRPRLPFLLTLQEGKELHRQSAPTRFWRQRIIRRADHITAISSYLAAYAAQEAAGVPIDLIPNGVALHPARHGARNPDPTILTVSRLVPKNNVEAVIRALPLVRATVTNAHLAVAGDGPLKSQLETLAAELGVRDAVGFMGTVPPDDLPTLYEAADVFVRPSLSEGLGSAFLEAMAAGVPVVGSMVGGIPDFLKDERTGLAVDPNDPKSIASAIVRLLTDAALKARIIENAAAMVHERYDWNAIAAQMSEVYKEMSQ